MVALRKELTRLFLTVTSEVYYEVTGDTTPYPYLQYELKEVMNNYGKTVYTLEVNILDYGVSTLTVETLSDRVQSLLHKYYYLNAEIQFVCYKLSKNTVQEEDKKIRRQRLTFEIQLHERNGE